MRFLLATLFCFSSLICLAQTSPAVSSHALKLADKDYRRALEQEKSGEIEEALQSVTAAVERAPSDVQYVAERAVLRQQVAASYLRRGNVLANAGDRPAAQAQFLSALALDPENTYALQRLHDVAQAKPGEDEHLLQLIASVDPVEVKPSLGRKSFHVHNDTRALYEQICKAFGVTALFDPGLAPGSVPFDMDDVDFYTAMRLAGKITKTFWSPVSDHEAMIAADTPEMRQQYERMAVRTFYVRSEFLADVNEIAAVMQNIFDLKGISVQAPNNTITVRAPKERVDAMAAMLDNLLDARPEVMVEVQVYELNSDDMRKLGLNMPTDFQIFSIAGEIYRILGPNAQPVIDQLSRTGTIDPATVPSDAFAKLQGSPLLTPFVYFGKGLGLTGISTPSVSAQLSRNLSSSANLDHVQLRALDGQETTFRLGTRFPIVQSTFTNVGLTAQGQPSVGSSTPSVQYEDLGVTLKTTPHYHRGDEVRLNLSLSIKSLGTFNSDGIPAILNREYTGSITVRDGEAAVVTGQMSQLMTRTSQGYPGVGQVPLVSAITGPSSKETQHQELLLVVTPHVISKPFRDTGSDTLWLP